LDMGDLMDKALEQLELEVPSSISRVERLRSEIQDRMEQNKPKPAPVAASAKSKPVVSPGSGGNPVLQVSPGTNHEGRKLPPLPAFKGPVAYDTPEADAIVAALQVFPVDNPWNQDISKTPLHPKSNEIVTTIGAGKRLHVNHDMCYVIAPPEQPKVSLTKMEYSGESDKGPYPIPDITPIEGWPHDYQSKKLTLDQVQRTGDGDRHAVVLDPVNMKIHEFYIMRKTDAGWEAACEATFDLRSNALRPKYWTSSDAAGLPIFPSIVRFDECERGMVEHAIRFSVRRTRRAFIPPATHYASRADDENLPPMGMRFRLKADVNIDSLPKHAKAVALAMKKYGMFVADNGSDWFISSSADPRLKNLEALHVLKGSDFEVVYTGEHITK